VSFSFSLVRRAPRPWLHVNKTLQEKVREKLYLSPRQRLHVVEKGGVIALVPEVRLELLRGALKGMSQTDSR